MARWEWACVRLLEKCFAQGKAIYSVMPIHLLLDAYTHGMDYLNQIISR